MRQKRKRFEVNKQLPHLIEPGKLSYSIIKGRWHSHYFQNKHPMVLEVGCGHGDYTIGLAKLYPERNFIGIDIKGDRLWKGAKQAQNESLNNVAFLRISLTQLLDFFMPNEVAEIWIPFPDPRPKGRDAKRRLTSARFLSVYHTLLKKEGKIHFKTDSALLFYHTLDLLQRMQIEPIMVTTDLYNSPLLHHHFGIQTTYEKRFLAQNMTIYYLCFSYNSTE